MYQEYYPADLSGLFYKGDKEMIAARFVRRHQPSCGDICRGGEGRRANVAAWHLELALTRTVEAQGKVPNVTLRESKL